MHRGGGWRRGAAGVLAAVLAAMGGLTAAGRAATKARPCPQQVTDARGDAHDWMVPNKPYFAEGDLLSIRLAPSGSTLVFTWRMASVTSPPVRVVNLNTIFRVGQGHSYSVSAMHAADGDDYQVEQWDDANHIGVEGTLRSVPGRFDTTAGTITALVPMSALGAHRNSAIYRIYGYVGEEAGVSAGAVGEDVDDYSGARTYYVGRNGC